MPKFEVWSEGYAATGQSGTAMYHGQYEAEDFRAAVRMAVEANPEMKPYVNFERLTNWGCRFFDNESDARKSFG